MNWIVFPNCQKCNLQGWVIILDKDIIHTADCEASFINALNVHVNIKPK